MRMGAKVRSVGLSLAAVLSMSACGAEGVEGSAGSGFVRGRVTNITGAPLASVEVTVESATVRTDSKGRFEVVAPHRGQLRVGVHDDMYTTTELAVTVGENDDAQVEIAVKPRRVLNVTSAKDGGRVQGDDGFVLDLPGAALVDEKGQAVDGPVEVRYAMINSANEVTAAPGRMRTNENKGLDGYAMAEVSFYKAGRRVSLSKEMTLELPLAQGVTLPDGQEVEGYQMNGDDPYWRWNPKGTVRGSRVVLRARTDAWISAATALPETSCMKGRLSLDTQRAAANTVIRAARTRGLSLIQAETHEDGTFCLPVTPDDDWSVSTYHDDGTNAYQLNVELRSDNAGGMCGGDTGCKDLGEVTLPSAES